MINSVLLSVSIDKIPVLSKIANNDLKYLLFFLFLFAVLLILYFISNYILRKIEKKPEYDLLSKARKALKAPVVFLLFVLSLGVPLLFIETTESIFGPVKKILGILTIVVFTWISIRAVRLFKHFVLKQYDIEQKDNLKARKVYTQFRIIERILIFAIIIIAVSLILMSFNGIRKIGVSLIASAGVTGIILGLAAQKIIGTVLAGFQLAITQPIRIEDVVIVENEWGWIEEINLTYVVVRIWDKRRLILPTTYFIEKPFQNWTRTTAEILGTVYIYTDYNVSFDALRKELTRLLEKTEYWDGQVNVLQVTDAKDKTIEIRALMSAVDSSTAWNLRVYIREKLLEFLQKNYPESLPRTRVTITNSPEK